MKTLISGRGRDNLLKKNLRDCECTLVTFSYYSDLEEDETCTTVTMDTEEWEFCLRKFLFISPPEDSVKTEAGKRESQK